ncbi:M4 family metallopeptidase [Paenibacillus polymyxa]|uniref:M4 family metallopeptidase n=1 Tax=Paenibacillus polymyxa TaxID=1406 RepID=UPI00202572D5|nr:M4 family metallopeptidase [Paenibacillus polymyxa]WDZ55419.1 M4 family metallopeptidase [Paenibacillus polymyxa]
MSEQHEHDRKDGFVPSYILEKLAERGNETAKETLIVTERIKKEDLKKNEVESIIAGAVGQSKRLNYDSETTEEMQRKLVRNEGDGPVQDQSVNNAYDFCGKTLEYYRNKLGLNSIDGRGMNVISNVHFGKNMLNAFWGQDQLSFGDGNGRDFKNFTNGIDVVAHECSHAVTQFMNELIYERQSGALNEHFSDVMGSAVKQYVKGQTAQTADWLIGDEIVGPEWPGIALRSMKAPGTASELDDQPAHMNDYRELPLSQDNGGVHKYSGIPNKVFFLTAQAIGTDPAALLWFTAWHNREIIHPRATFVEAFRAIDLAAEQLVQQGKLPREAVEAVRNACREVGIQILSPVGHER